MRILLDFDGTLCPDPVSRAPTTAPAPAAVAVLRKLKDAGHTITILSARAGDAMPGGWRARHAVREIRAYLDRYEIPYDDILTSKPECDAVIDKRALPFTGQWLELAKRLAP